MKNSEILDDIFLQNEEIDLSQIDFRGVAAGKAWQLEQALAKINRARTVLFVLAGLNVLPVIIMLVSGVPTNWVEIVLILVIAGIFLAAAFMIKKYPVISMLIPLFLYLAFLGLNILSDPSSIVRGFVWKVAIVTLLVVGIYNAIQAKKIKEDLIRYAKEQKLKG